MKGFIYKDLCLLGSVWKSYAFIFVMFLALTVTGVYDVSFLFMMVSVILCMYPSSSFSYDGLAKWDRFAVSVPNGRVKVVRAKYGFALLLGAFSLVMGLLLSLPAAFLGRMELSEGLLTCVGGAAGALLINAVLYIVVSLCTKCPEEIADKYITRVENYISAGTDMDTIVGNTILASTFRPEQLASKR